MLVLKPDEMRRVDKAAIEAGYPGILLMETAGRGVAEKVLRVSKPGSNILIFVGKGNNGGDGLVAARFLDMWGFRVKVVILAEERDLTESPLVNYRLCSIRGIEIASYVSLAEEKIKADLVRADLVIDALLGTGLQGSVREPFYSLIELINYSRKPVLAVDIPSGIAGENGQVLGLAVKADYTVSMAYPKLGLTLYPGREYVGELEIVDLGVPLEYALKTDPKHHQLTAVEAKQLLPNRSVTSHKGSFGKIGIWGGSLGMSGAPVLCGSAALKTGAGLVRLAVPAEIQSVVAAQVPELMTIGYEKIEDGLGRLEETADILAVGPGLGQAADITDNVYRLIKESEIPLVLDADGLNAIHDLEVLKERKSTLILTPHPGEMARLLGKDIEIVQKDRVGIARQFATTYHVYLVLKGAASIIALPDGRIYINPTGNEGMATAGSGDVLTGIISGLLAQGLAADKAAVLGPYLHGLAGDLFKDKANSYCLTASNIIANIQLAVNKLSLLL